MMHDTLRNAIIAVCKKLKTGVAVDEVELALISKELKRITGEMKGEIDHQLFMNFFSLAAVYHENIQLRKSAQRALLTRTNPGDHYTLTDANKENCHPQTDPLDFKNYSQQTKIKLLQKTSRELVFFFDGLSAGRNSLTKELLLDAVKKLNVLFGLVKGIKWKSDNDKESVLYELNGIYAALDGFGWQMSIDHKYSEDMFEQPLRSARLLVANLELIYSDLPQRTQQFLSSGKYLPSQGIFKTGAQIAQSGKQQAKPAAATNVLPLRPIRKVY